MKHTVFGIGVLALLSTGTALFAQSAWLKTNVDPGRAGVFVDGKFVGPAGNFGIGQKYALTPGKHEVKLIDPRYEELTTTVEIKAGKTTKLAEKLKALPPPKGPFGSLRTPYPEKYAAVYVNDHYYGHAGEFNNPHQFLMLPVGEYTVRIQPTTGSPITQKVNIEAGKTILVH